MFRSLRALSLGCLVALLFAMTAGAPVLAQGYPSRTVTVIVPFPPGGSVDGVGRIIVDKLNQSMGPHFIVENRAGGASGNVGANVVAKADPDGYTLLMAIDGTLVMNPFLYSKLSYDPFKDFAPITLVADVPSVIEANNSVAANTVQELIDEEKANPGKLNMGYSTPTSQVTAELLNMRAGIKLTLVPYRGGTTQVTGLLGGEIQLGLESVNVALPFARAGKLKIIALTGGNRISLAQDIPTVAETLPGFDLGIWQSVVAPSKTPPEIVELLHDEIVAVLSRESVRNKLTTQGVEPAVSESPQEFAKFIRAQAEVRSKVIRAVGIKLD
jgi:tripartite-type tricarboxylate transporter receptor subunit TctC